MARVRQTYSKLPLLAISKCFWSLRRPRPATISHIEFPAPSPHTGRSEGGDMASTPVTNPKVHAEPLAQARKYTARSS